MNKILLITHALLILTLFEDSFERFCDGQYKQVIINILFGISIGIGTYKFLQVKKK